MKNTQIAHLALLGANMLYGAGFTVAKIVMPSLVQPRAFILMRVLVACVLLWITVAVLHRGSSFWSLKRGDQIRVLLGGLFGVSLNMELFFEGLALTEPFHAAVIMLTTPILVMVFSAIFLARKFGWYQISGLVLGVSGALLLTAVGGSRSSSYAPNIFLGDTLIFLNASCYAIYLVIIKPVMDKRASLQVVAWVFTVGCLLVVPAGLSEFPQIDFSRFGPIDWSALVFVILGVTYFTYVWNAYGIKNLSPVITGAYIYTQPVFAAIIAILYYKEIMTLNQVLAAVFIATGVWLVNRKPRKPTPVGCD